MKKETTSEALVSTAIAMTIIFKLFLTVVTIVDLIHG